MKEKWYRSNFVKGILVIAEHLSLVVAVLSILAVSAMYQQGIRFMDNRGGTYTDSRGFAEEVYNISRDIVLAMDSDLTLEENTSRVVDLKEIYDGTDLTYTNTSGLAYNLEDLQNWAQSGWLWDNGYTEGENIIVCRKPDETYVYYRYEEFAELFRSGELKFAELFRNGEQNSDIDDFGMYESGESESGENGEWAGDEEKITSKIMGWFSGGQMPNGLEPAGVAGILNAAGEIVYDDAYSYTDMMVEEKYSPVGADSLLDVVNANPEWNARLRQANEALNEALNLVGSASAHSQILTQYKEGNTNLTYLFVDTDGRKIYTNESAFKRYEDYESYLKQMAAQEAPYMIIRPTLSECETNMNADTYIWQHMVETESGSNKYVYAVQIDNKFPINDVLANKQKNYDTYAKWQLPVLAAGVLSIVIFLIGLVWLTMVAGRRPKDEALYLCAFDKWFTEAAAALVFGIWILGIWMGTPFSALIAENLQNRVYIAFCVLYTAAMFLIGYLSLVRRIKAQNLWKNSLLRRLFLYTKRLGRKLGGLLEIFSRNTSSKIKTTLLMGGFLFLQFIINGLIYGVGMAGFLFILIVIDVVTLFYFLLKADGRDRILEGLKRITDGELQYKIPLERLTGEQKTMAEYINRIGEGLDAAVENSLKNERMKTELITNVSHDIKTPLTSIINYVDLLKRENFTDPKICGYLDVLEAKAQRLKTLTEDVVEASKVSTGNITLEMTDLNFVEMIHQVIGEFEEKFQEKQLMIMVHFGEEPAVIYADGQRMWRVLENIFNNVVKYAMEGTRVYADVKVLRNKVYFSLKNISAQPLNISADELTERFIRGDVSRNTEGSGLGLSIAQSLVQLQGGEFKLYLDGDLFKVVISFPAK